MSGKLSVKCITKISLLNLLISAVVSCSTGNNSERNNNISRAEMEYYNGSGVGPVKEVLLDKSIDSVKAANGEKIFQSKCITCHLISEERRIGPGLKGITLRRRPEWIMNQILNPLEMSKSDSLSKELLLIYLSQMTDMNLTREDARNVLEYFRKLDEGL